MAFFIFNNLDLHCYWYFFLNCKNSVKYYQEILLFYCLFILISFSFFQFSSLYFLIYFLSLIILMLRFSLIVGRWLSCAQPRQCPKILTLYQRKKEVCSVRSRGSPWQRSRLALPRKRPGRKSFSREERKARYERGRMRSSHDRAFLIFFAH